jgi:hypothetical protein
MSNKKYTLPANCSIERVGNTKRDRAFQLRFQADEGVDFVSEAYVPEKGETIQKAAYKVCLKFDWDRNPPGCKGRLITSLKDFLDWRGCGDDPYSWARAYYKYTDCGPWVNFLELVTPAHEIDHPSVVAVLYRVRGKVKLMNPEEIDTKYLQLLALDERGLDRKERKWDHYRKLVEDYIADEAKQARTKRTLTLVKKTATELHLQQPARTEYVEAGYREVYYEDLGRGSITLDPEKCCGIQFGSIVEGSDQCSGPFTHMFPFWSSEWTRDEEFMEKETAFYWRRDNASWYRVRTEDDEWVVANVWGDIEWEDDGLSDGGSEIPPDIKALAEEAIKNDWQEDPRWPGGNCVAQTIPRIPNEFGWGQRPEPKEGEEWKAMPLGDTGAEIYTFDDDTVFD